VVKLNRIYTRTGDSGTTGLGDGARVSKDHARVEAYGTVDEANAFVGLAVAECEQGGGEPMLAEIGALLKSIQHDLFDVGADLCCPYSAGETEGEKLRILPRQTERLERAIDRYNAGLQPLRSFVLPGGSRVSAAMHAARTVVRRAERCCVALITQEPQSTSTETVKYLNRLSDLLFVLSRVTNHQGAGDVLWVPGANRSAEQP
jgi:cob(I)alamin adenosyltransferase